MLSAGEYAIAVDRHGLYPHTSRPSLPYQDVAPVGREPYEHAATLIYADIVSYSFAVECLMPEYLAFECDDEFETYRAYCEKRLIAAVDALDFKMFGKPPPAPINQAEPPRPPDRRARDPIRRSLSAFAFGLLREAGMTKQAYMQRLRVANAQIGRQALAEPLLKSLAIYCAKKHLEAKNAG